MPRKQRFKPSRKPKLAEGTFTMDTVGASSADSPAASIPLVEATTEPAPPVFRHLRGRDAVIDD